MALSRRTGARFQGSIWPGFVDAMTGLLLVLMFVLTIFMIVQFVLRETISGQADELDKLSTEVSALASALGLAQTENTNLTQRVGALTATLSDSQEQIRQQTIQITALTAQRDRQLDQLAAADARITGFEAQVAALIAAQQDADAKIAGLLEEQAQDRDQIDELLTEQEALNLALSSARSEIDAQTEAARLAAARREALEALIADLETDQAARTAENAALSAELSELSTKLSEEEAARLAEAAAAQALRERLENADAELTVMTLSLEAQRREAEDTLTLLAAARAAEEDLVERLTAALAEAAEKDGLQGELDAALAALAASEETLADRQNDQEKLREQLAAALTAQVLAQNAAAIAADARDEALTAAEERALLLQQAQDALADEAEISTEAQRQTELLNQQVAALREQLGGLQALLDDAKDRDAAQQIELQTLGSDLNAALARAAAEERKRRRLEEAERERLELEQERLRAEAEAAAGENAELSAETRRLAEQAEELALYKSEFFGRLRELLADQEGVRIVGDRFVFSSEVLFAAGSADLSVEGEAEIAKIARILRNIAGDIPETIDWVIRVDGHTDDTPITGGRRYRDNWELSQARALSVVRFMANDLGIPPNRLAANGFGEFQPLDSADTPEARARNRRIELKLTEK